MFINVLTMPKNHTWQNPWLNANQHPPATGWYCVRHGADEFDAFYSAGRWLEADYTPSGVRRVGVPFELAGLEYLPDGR